MSNIDDLPDSDADLDALHMRLHHAGILDDARRHQEPFKTFEVAYNNLLSATFGKNADPKIVEQHRQAARAAAPAVLEALGEAPAPVRDESANGTGEPQAEANATDPAATSRQPQDAMASPTKSGPARRRHGHRTASTGQPSPEHQGTGSDAARGASNAEVEPEIDTSDIDTMTIPPRSTRSTGSPTSSP